MGQKQDSRQIKSNKDRVRKMWGSERERRHIKMGQQRRWIKKGGGGERVEPLEQMLEDVSEVKTEEIE